MVFNRILQVINIKLEVMQEYEKLINPLTTKYFLKWESVKPDPYLYSK